MTKTVFLRTLSEKLVSFTPERISPSDAVRALNYYEEMIDDRMEDGMSEEEAVAAVGHPDDVFRAVLASLSAIPKTEPDRAARAPDPVALEPERKKRSPWLVALLIVSSPVWISLLIAAGAVLFSLYVVLWALIVSSWAVFAGLAGGGALLIVSSVPLFAENGLSAAMASLGMGLAAIGLAILFFLFCIAATRFAARLTVSSLRGVLSLFDRKERRS